MIQQSHFRLRAFLIIALSCTVLACAMFQPSERPSGTPLQDAQTTVDALQALKAGLRVPNYLSNGEPKRGDEFDVNTYFTVLERLSLEEGEVLDYVYYFDGMGGAPYLYVRPETQPPFATYQDYLAAIGGDRNCTWCGYLDHIHTDDTPEGYFQFVLLRILGDQFYLDWHANYHDATPVCDKAAIEAVLQDLDGEIFRKMPAGDRVRARRLDVAPTVTLEETQAIVSLVIFTKWGGFIRETFTLSRDFPHQILNFEKETLLEYQCGLMF